MKNMELAAWNGRSAWWCRCWPSRSGNGWPGRAWSIPRCCRRRSTSGANGSNTCCRCSSPKGGRDGWWSWALSGELVVDTITSLYRVVVGFAIGGGLALPLGLAMGASPAVYAWMNPLVQILRPIPPIAYIPLAILWFGLGNPPAVFLIALGAFFPVLMNTIAGVRQVDGIYLRAARSLGAGRTTMFVRVILPAAVPYILSGVRIGIGTAFIVVIVSEMIAVNNGLGFRILEAREYFWSDKIIAGMISIGMLGLAIDIGMNRLNNYLLRWHRGLEH
jgi:NitT/TauT family transport system permease protein